MTVQTIAPPEIRAVLLDIEGTTTPIDFVYRVLFPYARDHVAAFLEAHHDEADVADIISLLSSEQDKDVASGSNPPPWETYTREEEIKSAVEYVHWLMSHDRKSTPLKTLQGLIWQEGYEKGEIKGQLFPDVPLALERWGNKEISVWVFSSGSVLAQRLLFGCSEAGDLTEYFLGFFDTHIGPKKESASYTAIAEKIGLPAGEILFVSDVVEELDAAHTAGMKTLLSIRPGNRAQPEHNHPSTTTFDVL